MKYNEPNQGDAAKPGAAERSSGLSIPLGTLVAYFTFSTAVAGLGRFPHNHRTSEDTNS